MSDITTPPPVPPSPPAYAAAPADEMRTMVIIVYGLLLGGLVCGGLSSVAGVILAYIKRGEAKGTIWEGHLQNAIHAFWVSLVLFVVGIPLTLIFVGVLVMLAGAIYLLYRTIKGLIAAIDSKPYV
ncbi:MAG: hypothetical protein WDN03_00980 [Rhizomicrobium sp.]